VEQKLQIIQEAEQNGITQTLRKHNLAHSLYLRWGNPFYQEFSHVATHQDNAYIEALHSNFQREVIDRFEFESIFHAQMVIDRYYKWYNEKRRHWSLNGQTPETVWNNYNPIPFENEKLPNYL